MCVPCWVAVAFPMFPVCQLLVSLCDIEAMGALFTFRLHFNTISDVYAIKLVKVRVLFFISINLNA